MDFGKRLKKFRKESNMTQKDLASKIGVSRTTIAGYETEGKMPPYDTLVKIAKTLNCSIDYLLDYNVKDGSQDNQIINPDMKNLYKKISQRKDLQLLIKETEDLNPYTIKRIVEIINLIKKENNSRDK